MKLSIFLTVREAPLLETAASVDLPRPDRVAQNRCSTARRCRDHPPTFDSENPKRLDKGVPHRMIYHLMARVI